MRYIKWLVVILLIPPFLIGCIFLSLILHKLDWGTVPDWFSFVANAGTVIVTLFIAKNAKKFLDDKVHSEGISRGYKILDSIDEINDKLSTLVIRTINNHHVVEMASNQEKNHQNYILSSATEMACKINIDSREYIIKIKNVQSMLKRLQRWHVEISNPKEFNYYIDTCSELLESLSYISGYNYEIEYPDTEYSYTKVKNFLAKINPLHKNTEKAYNAILSLKFKDTFRVI